MNTEINFIDNTINCDESNNAFDKSCDESCDSITDRSNSWYILPIILNNTNLCNKNNIIGVNYTDLVTMSLLTIEYKKNCLNDIKEIKSNSELFYNDSYSNNSYTITIKIPDDKKYLCDIISKKGSVAINKQLFNEYFLKLL